MCTQSAPNLQPKQRLKAPARARAGGGKRGSQVVVQSYNTALSLSHLLAGASDGPRPAARPARRRCAATRPVRICMQHQLGKGR